MLCTAPIAAALMMFVACCCCNKRRKTRFVVNALNGIIKEETINNKKVLIFGGRKLPELDYDMMKNSTFKPPGDLLGFLRMYFWLVISSLCCFRRYLGWGYLSLGGALLVFSITFVSALVQIFIAIASLEVTFKCRYDLFLDCFEFSSNYDSSPVNCTTSVQDRIFICYRLVVFYPHNWLLACVKTFLFAKMMHIVLNFFARAMLFQANCCSLKYSISTFFVASFVVASLYISYVKHKMTHSEEYQFSTTTNWRLAAGTILVLIFIWVIPWKEIGNEKMEALDVASKASEEQ